MHRPSQLPLVLPHDPHYGRDAFMPGPSNAAALRLVESWPGWPSPVVVLSGPPGSGKTHLVHVWAARANAEILAAAALGGELSLDQTGAGPLAIDGINPGAVPDAALFHLINRVGELGSSLLLTSRQPADCWRIALPDLRSRLRMAAPASIGAPDDDLLRIVLVKLFADRQLVVDRPVIDYLLTRMERSLSAANALVDALDQAGLAENRRITRPMAAEILAASDGRTEAFAVRQ